MHPFQAYKPILTLVFLENINLNFLSAHATR